MAKYLSRVNIIGAIGLVALLAILVVSGCNNILEELGGGPEVTGPGPGIQAPPQGSQVLVGSPVQIESTHSAADISRVELWVMGPDSPAGRLLRADVPENNYLLQQWVPPRDGVYTITVRSVTRQEQHTDYIRQVTAVTNPAITGVVVGPQAAAEFQPPTATAPIVVPSPAPTQIVATPLAGAGAANVTPEVSIAVVQAQVVATPSPTPVPLYPPPPPAPGVPWGPVESDPDYGPPQCDAAEVLGVYSADTSRRVVITEPDQAPAKVVGGTSVFRAWRLRNIGLCTWGPGYELAFYGGRSMGSGGVAFESTFPSETVRRNAIVDTNRLIVPEGRPNEVAVLEVMLNAPVTPGIHQSYWRMRNPRGEYFGPILGVTLEVVRDCKFGIYGAPVINKFEILGVGNVYRPDNPVSVQAELGQNFTLEWNIINASNFDIVFEDPTGAIQSVTTTDPSGRATFPASRVGRHTITLYADNGPCTAQAQVFIDVVPASGDQFLLDITLSSASPCAGATTAGGNISISSTLSRDTVTAQWEHFDKDADEFDLIARAYRRVYKEQCPVVESIFGWKGHCYMEWSDWQATGQQAVVQVGGEGDAQGAATVANVERKLIPENFNPAREEYGIQYTMQAKKNGQPASPQFSNTVDVRCNPITSTLPIEIPGAGAQFNPQ